MAAVHELITKLGVEQARKLVPSSDRKIIDTAAQALAIESRAMGITYAGFCLTALPHNPLADDAIWERQGHKVKLVITPGYLPDRDGSMQLHGVPYGSRARLIMLYLQTRAIQTGSPEVELGGSMKDWLSRMGIGVGGKQYREIKEQANRISACNLTFVWDNDRKGKAFEKDAIVKGGIQLYEHDDENQLRLWVDTVRLSDSFFQALKEHPVPVWEPAMKLISSRSMAIDIYVWLAYRLHVLEQATPVTWMALFSQFGHSYANLKHFKPRFTEALKMATAVYPEAKIAVEDTGVILHPSPSPITKNQSLR